MARVFSGLYDNRKTTAMHHPWQQRKFWLERKKNGSYWEQSNSGAVPIELAEYPVNTQNSGGRGPEQLSAVLACSEQELYPMAFQENLLFSARGSLQETVEGSLWEKLVEALKALKTLFQRTERWQLPRRGGHRSYLVPHGKSAKPTLLTWLHDPVAWRQICSTAKTFGSLFWCEIKEVVQKQSEIRQPQQSLHSCSTACLTASTSFN